MDILENIPELNMEEQKRDEQVEPQNKEEKDIKEVNRVWEVKEVKEVKALPKGDKVYQSVRAEILLREKEKNKGTTRANRDKKLRDVKNGKTAKNKIKNTFIGTIC